MREFTGSIIRMSWKTVPDRRSRDTVHDQQPRSEEAAIGKMFKI